MIGEIKKTQTDWDLYYLDIALAVSMGSKDPNRKVGAILVTKDKRQLSFGYNGFPANMPDLKSYLKDKDFKNLHMVHAEDNCLRQAPFPTEGCSLYVTRFPCEHCAEKIAKAKVARLVAPKPDLEHPTWGPSWERSLDLFAQSGVSVTIMHFLEK